MQRGSPQIKYKTIIYCLVFTCNVPFVLYSSYLDLKLSVIAIYRNILKERQKRKETIKKYGLINLRKQHLVERRYYGTVGFHRMERLRSLMKVMDPVAWDMYLESLHYEAQLRTSIHELQVRGNGGFEFII